MGATSQPTTQPAAPGTRSGHWQRLLTKDGGTIKALFVDPKNPSVLYAETALGLFKSSDGAGSWSQTLDFSTLADSVILVAFDPASPSTVFLLTSSSESPEVGIPPGCFRSDDGGATWTDLSEGSPPLGGWPVAIWFDTTTSPSTVYASGWRSTDRGESWTELSSEEADRRWAQHWEEPGTDFQNTDFQGRVTDANTGRGTHGTRRTRRP